MRVTEAWESSFFGFPILEMELEPSDVHPDRLSTLAQSISDELEKGSPEHLFKASLDAQLIQGAPVLERLGFELWETRFVWMTQMTSSLLVQEFGVQNSDSTFSIHWNQPEDNEEIVEMAVELVAQSHDVITRFDSPFYPSGSGSRWYKSWLEDVLNTPSTLVSLARHKPSGKLAGFFLYQRKGEQKGCPVFKGILSAVSPEFRGNKLHIHLQKEIFKKISKVGETVWLDNTTQLSNYPIIRNHARSGRRPQEIQLVFFKGPHRKDMVP